MLVTSKPLVDAALLGIFIGPAIAVVLAIVVARLLSWRVKQILSSVDEPSDEQLARAAARQNDAGGSRGCRLLRVFRVVDEIDRESVRAISNFE